MPVNAQTALLLPLLNESAAPMILRAAKSPIPIDATEVALADIVECDFEGYAGVPLTDFGETENDYTDVGDVLTEPVGFEAADPLPAAQAIHFLYITREEAGQPTKLAQVFNLPAPIEMAVPGQRVEFQVRAQCEGLV